MWRDTGRSSFAGLFQHGRLHHAQAGEHAPPSQPPALSGVAEAVGHESPHRGADARVVEAHEPAARAVPPLRLGCEERNQRVPVLGQNIKVPSLRQRVRIYLDAERARVFFRLVRAAPLAEPVASGATEFFAGRPWLKRPYASATERVK